MVATVRRVELTPSERRTAARINAGLALMPRLKTDNWRLEAGQWASARLGVAAQTVTAAWLRRRGIRVETLRVPSSDGDVCLRILHPSDPPRGVILDMHGGGWVVGSAGLNDHLNAGLVAATGLAVVSVDYRLLSERRGVLLDHAIADCLTAGRWLAANAEARFGTDNLFLIGESAGAHLAALTALSLRDEDRFAAFRGCVFIYGVFDLSGTPSVRAANRDTLLLNGPTMAADMARLLSDRDEAGRRRPDVSPLYAGMHDLPPALFVSGDLDPLRDDSALMAEAWSTAAPAELVEVPLAPHGFVHFGGPLARKAMADVATWLEHRLTNRQASGAHRTKIDPVSPTCA
ncbi:MAG: alpha/beta hydrolase [Brevundimonas sp.]|nr:alpha/beta hydrolase [Brevundimonas sp.]